jgi:hypothetical protein
LGRRGRRFESGHPDCLACAAILLAGPIDALSGDWPGWDDGWTLVVFPLGIPLALWIALRSLPSAALATLAVWGWGVAVFLAWWAFGG